MGAFYTVAKLPVDDVEKFCAWYLKEFVYQDEYTPVSTKTGLAPEMHCISESVMMALVVGFYSNPQLGRLAYILCKHDLKRVLHILEKTLEEYNRK